MLPTKGYFQDIECPYFDSVCSRPYCHFRHRKKGTEIAEELVTEAAPEPEVPTYKPTPKSELANIKSHIPISYVPDLAFRPDRPMRSIPKLSFEKPTYNPTPLSILSSANKESKDEEETKAVREIKLNIASVEYNPAISLKTDINFEDLSAEFDLIDGIIDPEPSPPQEEIKIKEEPVVEKPRSRSSTSKHSSSKSHKSKHRKSDTKDKHKDDKHRSKRKDESKERKSSSSKSSKSRDRDKDRKSSKSSKDKDRHREKKSKEPDKKVKLSDGEDNEILANFSDVEFEDEEDTLMECYKIFNEYKPPEVVEVPSAPPPEVLAEEVKAEIGSKKRIAHSSTGAYEPPARAPPKVLFQASPALIMANRLKSACLSHANNEQRNIMEEVKQHTNKRTAPPSLLEAARKFKLQKTVPKPVENVNLIDSILNGAKAKPKKIAPVQNVNSIQRAKAKIEELAKHKAAEALNKTVAQTVKGAKRVAHVPDLSLSDIPDVLNADKSKLPINVRTRFLTMIAEECAKLYLMRSDAYNRALTEEFTCYEKCKVLITYKNSAMLAVSRLRKELQEREKSGLGPIGSGETSDKEKSSDYKGRKFYNHVKSYLLSEEDLELHGYPKESEVPGRAIIKSRKPKAIYTLPENQRKCCRCSKIYLVDESGFVLYPEECVYHPLKKRTLRGEQMFLCCKSNDDTGCATSNTHVSETSETADWDGFQTTMKPERDDDPRSIAVYALDCEMCYTVKGLELTRVTIVDTDCKTVYESLVKPLNPIIDYNTNFSGITKEQMDRTSTNILQVQANILHLCNSETILIGHSLESDMKALKIVHGAVIDTSVLFPHKMGLPHKRALRVLASEYLKKIIQNGVNGHDSAEDAIACMDLVKWKLKEELKVRGIK